MNPQEILEAARAAIAAGEDPDDVAAWIEQSGVSLDALESGFAGDGAGRTWEPTPLGKLRENDRQIGVPSNRQEFTDAAADAFSVGAGGLLAKQGLGAAVKAIQGVRAARAAPLAQGALPAQYGRAVPYATEGRRTALDALRTFVKRGAPYAKGAAVAELTRRLF